MSAGCVKRQLFPNTFTGQCCVYSSFCCPQVAKRISECCSCNTAHFVHCQFRQNADIIKCIKINYQLCPSIEIHDWPSKHTTERGRRSEQVNKWMNESVFEGASKQVSDWMNRPKCEGYTNTNWRLKNAFHCPYSVCGSQPQAHNPYSRVTSLKTGHKYVCSCSEKA